VKVPLDFLDCGSCEELKLGVHAAALGLVAVMGLYNAAAWLSRRERHLAVNTVLYAMLTAWEQQHVIHHLREMRCDKPVKPPTDQPMVKAPQEPTEPKEPSPAAPTPHVPLAA
jgi:hypothetical protein